jgi:hypothetical protein
LIILIMFGEEYKSTDIIVILIVRLVEAAEIEHGIF